MAFLALVIGALDFGQVLVKHQMMVERVRGTLRWAVARPYDATTLEIKNMILFNQTTVPQGGFTQAFLNLNYTNINVVYTPPTQEEPNDVLIRVSIVNYPYQFVSPWIAKAVTGARPVVQSAPVIYRP